MLGTCHIQCLAGEGSTERRVVLNLSTQTRSLGSVVEVSAYYVGKRRIHGDITPNRAPKTCTIDREHVNTVIKDVDRNLERSIAQFVAFGLKVGSAVNLSVSFVQIADLLTFCIY